MVYDCPEPFNGRYKCLSYESVRSSLPIVSVIPDDVCRATEIRRGRREEDDGCVASTLSSSGRPSPFCDWFPISGENRIHGIQAALQREMNLCERQHGYSQAISEAGHVQNSINKLTDVTVT